MSGIKRVIEEKDPDYEEISVAHPSKRHKAAERSGRNGLCLNLTEDKTFQILCLVKLHWAVLTELKNLGVSQEEKDKAADRESAESVHKDQRGA